MYQSAIQVRTAFDKRRTSLEIGVGYEDDLDQAETAILEACRSAEVVLDDPDPQAYLIGLGDNAVLFDLRYWTDPHQADVRRIEHNVFKAVRNRLDAEGFDMPFPIRTLEAAPSLVDAIRRRTDEVVESSVERDELEGMTRDELYEIAQEIDLSGRSTMSRVELVDGLAAES